MADIYKKTCLALTAILLSASSYAAGGNADSTAVFEPCGNYGRLYDIKTVETLQGTIARIDKVDCRRAGTYSIHLTVQQAKESIPVFIGPAWYLEKQGVKLSEGDRIQATGSKITLNGRHVLLAKEIKKGDQLLRLRNDGGMPLWAGRTGRGMRP